MLLIIREKASAEGLKKMAEDFDGYVKVVVDVEKEILAGGGKRHFEGEQRLLEEGSKQINLWGGGVDLASGEIDYDSIINIRPQQGNSSRVVMSGEIRERFDKIVKSFLLS